MIARPATNPVDAAAPNASLNISAGELAQHDRRGFDAVRPEGLAEPVEVAGAWRRPSPAAVVSICAHVGWQRVPTIGAGRRPAPPGRSSPGPHRRLGFDGLRRPAVLTREPVIGKVEVDARGRDQTVPGASCFDELRKLLRCG